MFQGAIVDVQLANSYLYKPCVKFAKLPSLPTLFLRWCGGDEVNEEGGLRPPMPTQLNSNQKPKSQKTSSIPHKPLPVWGARSGSELLWARRAVKILSVYRTVGGGLREKGVQDTRQNKNISGAVFWQKFWQRHRDPTSKSQTQHRYAQSRVVLQLLLLSPSRQPFHHETHAHHRQQHRHHGDPCCGSKIKIMLHAAARQKHGGLHALTPGCQIGYLNHTGCHQLNVLTTRPTRVVTPGCHSIGYMDHTGYHQLVS
jgi:hypothetical protein